MTDHAAPSPELREAAPHRPGLLARAARGLLALFGWRVEVVWPPGPKAVIAVYPHTSNWDFVIGMLGRLACGLPVSWLGKHSIFRWPFRTLLRKLGGIAVDRRQHHGLVTQMLAEFSRRPVLWLALAPEGTRKHTDHLKSGFWRIACEARVPLGLGYLDYRRRVVGVAEWIHLSGDPEEDLARLRSFYADKAARKPAQASEIRFRDCASVSDRIKA